MNMNCAMTRTFSYSILLPHQKLPMLEIPQKGEILRRASMEKKIGNQFEAWMVSTGGRRGMEEVGTT